MRIVVQRVSKAKCIVDNKVVSEIGKGFMLLVGFTHTDTIKEVETLARKINNLRIFEDEFGKINLNIHDAKGDILSISQFTLYADTKKSNRPSFTDSMKPDAANDLYIKFNEILNNTYNIKTLPGVFGAHMDLEITCDGPVTITLEA